MSISSCPAAAGVQANPTLPGNGFLTLMVAGLSAVRNTRSAEAQVHFWPGQSGRGRTDMDASNLLPGITKKPLHRCKGFL